MGIAVHTGVGHGAIRPSGRSVQPNGLTDFAFVHAGQYGTQESLVFSDSAAWVNLSPSNIDTFTFSDGSQQVLLPVTHADSDTFAESVFGGYPKGNNTDTFLLADAQAQNIPYNATATQSVPLSDQAAYKKDGSTDLLPLGDNAAKV